MGNCFRTASQIVDPVETRLEHVSVGVPDYDKFQTSTIATGKRGRAPGELYLPQAVAIDEDTHQIFVANYSNNRVEIFSETGEYICQLGVRQLYGPYGIAIHGDNVYVSCGDNTVNRFSLTDMSLVRKIGGGGSNDGQFKWPRQLTTDSTGRVFIADTYNYRICIHDPNLNHLYNCDITHESMSRPSDVRISHNCLYVLCPHNNPCMLVLTLEGDKLHSLITRGEMSYPQFFCLDPFNNFVISSNRSHSIRVFSPEGNLLHTIGREGHQPGKFPKLDGLTITPNGRFCVVSNVYDLQLYIISNVFSSS